VSNRLVIGLTILMIGLITAGWYVLAAPSRGSAVEPGASGLVVTAVQVGPSGWVRYQVTLSNVGDQDWSGDLRLVNRPPRTGAGTPQNVPGLQLPAPPQVGDGRVPSGLPDAALQVRVSIQARHQRVIQLTGQDHYASVELVGHNGQIIYSSPVEISPAVPVAVLSDSDIAPAALAQVRIGDMPIRVLSFSKAPSFPSSVLQLGQLAAVVVDQFDMASLSQPQMAALRDYVGLGGSLILAGGASWRRTLQPVPADLSPIRAGATISQSLQPVAVLGGGESAPTAPVAVGEIAQQARVTLSGQTAPLIVELAYGGGRVITLAFDPAAEPVQGLKLAGTSWSQALGRAVLKSRGANGWAASAIPGPSLATAASMPLPDEAPPPPVWLLGLGLLAYMLVIGPLNLALSRRLGRPDLLWVTIPVLAVASTAGLYLAGGILHAGTQDEQLQVVRLGPKGSISTVEYHEILFGQRGQHTLQSSPNALLAPMTLGLHQAAVADCPNCVQQLGGLPRDVAEHALPGSQPVIIENGVAYGNVRVVSVATAGQQQLGLEAHLSAVQGRIQGKIANLSDRAISDLALYTFDGERFRRTDLVALVAPGEQVDVDAQPRAMDITPTAAPGLLRSPGQSLADTVARAALSVDPQPILLGFTEPLKSHLRLDGSPAPKSAAAVVQRTVRLDSADTMLRDWEQVRLLASAGDQRAGFQAVYDIDLPAAPGLPLTLSFDSRQHSSVEVYDWRQKAWRSGPWTQDPQNAANREDRLRPDEISGGTVRVRVKEPRLSWGASIWVETAVTN
jgi:hypothetical protein